MSGQTRGHPGHYRPLRCIAFLAAAIAQALAAAGCGAGSDTLTPTSQPPAPPTPTLTVMTYNVNFGMPRPDLAVAAILEADADVVCLQETTHRWEQYLSPALGKRYPHRLFRHWPAAGGMAVFSKHPIEERAVIPPKRGWFPAWLIRVDSRIGPVQIMQFHLRPSVSPRGQISLGAVFEAPEDRKVQVDHAVAHCRVDQPAILLGDFNEGDGGAAVRLLRRRGFTDALGRFDWFTPTWRWRVGLLTLQDRLDHIMFSAHLRAVEARVIPAGASDHLPVIGRFVRAGTTP